MKENLKNSKDWNKDSWIIWKKFTKIIRSFWRNKKKTKNKTYMQNTYMNIYHSMDLFKKNHKLIKKKQKFRIIRNRNSKKWKFQVAESVLIKLSREQIKQLIKNRNTLIKIVILIRISSTSILRLDSKCKVSIHINTKSTLQIKTLLTNHTIISSQCKTIIMCNLSSINLTTITTILILISPLTIWTMHSLEPINNKILIKRND